MSPGVYHDMPAADYHAAPGVSASMLKAFRRSPAHMKTYLASKGDRKESLVFGTMSHVHLFEPELIHENYFVIPQVDLRTADGKAQRDAAILDNPGKIIVRQDDFDCAVGTATVCRANSTVAEILRTSKREVSLFGIDPATGLLIRGRPDCIGGVILDLKTTQDARSGAFGKQIVNLGYHIQAAMYLRLANLNGMNVEWFTFCAVETGPPHGLCLWTMNRECRRWQDDGGYWHEEKQSDMEIAEAELDRLLGQYAECEKKGEWPAYTPAVREIRLPRWGLKSDDAQVIYEGE